VALDAIERDPACGARAVVPLSRMLPRLSSIILTSEGVRHAIHGRDVGPSDTEKGVRPPYSFFVRLVDPAGELVAIASTSDATGLLHPSVVLM
jgi:hypothetical protein